jgi:hypothetical protein
VLSVALVFGGFGGTVAAADTDTDGTVSDAPGPTGAEHEVVSIPTESTPTDSTETTVSPAVVETVPPLIGTFDSGALLESDHEETSAEETARGTEEEAAGLTGPMALGVTTGSQTGTGAPATTDENKGSDTVSADATQRVNEPEVVVSHSPVTEPSPEPDGPGAEVNVPAADPPAEEPTVVQPAANDVAPVGTSPAEDEAASSVVGRAAEGNLIAVLAHLFSGAPDGDAPLIALPSGLLWLLGFPLVGDVAVTHVAAGGIGGSLLAGGIFTDARTQPTSSVSAQASWPEMLIGSGGARALARAGAVVHRALDGVSATGVKEEHLSMGLTDSIVPEQVRSILRHAIGAVLAPLSLLVLALMASPGIAGLVLLGAAGTFIGYRQARAASILRAVGIARFVKAGPLGVVRSGGLVAVHSRTPRLHRGQSRRAAASLETVA